MSLLHPLSVRAPDLASTFLCDDDQIVIERLRFSRSFCFHRFSSPTWLSSWFCSIPPVIIASKLLLWLIGCSIPFVALNYLENWTRHSSQVYAILFLSLIPCFFPLLELQVLKGTCIPTSISKMGPAVSFLHKEKVEDMQKDRHLLGIRLFFL